MVVAVSKVAGSLITILVGIAAIGATWTGTYANYVKLGLRWPLIISGLVLIAAGTASLVLSTRSSGGHHHGAQGIGALLVVFVAALAMAPPPLGAAAAADRIPNRVAITEAPAPIEERQQAPQAVPAPSTASSTSTTVFVAPDPPEPEPGIESIDTLADDSVLDTGAAPLPQPGTGDELYAITLYDLIGYTYFAPDEIIGVPFQLVGFAAAEPDVPGAFRLTRYLIDCCAADAAPLQVTLASPPFLPELDQWVVAEAVWHGELTDVNEYGDGVPVLEVRGLTPIDPPPDPYES